MIDLDSISFWVNLYAIILTIIGSFIYIRKIPHLWKTRYLRRVWGIKDGEKVTIVCSELDDPEKRQNLEEREYIYSLKYGDLDAYIEVLVTLLSLYPSLKLRVISVGEINHTKQDLSTHIVVVGGPDYNELTKKILKTDKTRFNYKSPYLEISSETYPDEIVIFDKITNKEYCSLTDDEDFGYFEQLPNPYNPENKVILLGGCHTIGVTGAVKAFSSGISDDGKISKIVLRNSKNIWKWFPRKWKYLPRKFRTTQHYSVLLQVHKIGQNISIPEVKDGNIFLKNE